MELVVEASPRRVYANAHTYHINSISVNTDQETFLSADDLRVNLWHLEITDQSFSTISTQVGHWGWWPKFLLGKMGEFFRSRETHPEVPKTLFLNMLISHT